MSVKTSPRRATTDRRKRLAKTLHNPNADVRAMDLLVLGGAR
jgi:hypothetical protein